MEDFVGLKLELCIKDLVKACFPLPLKLIQATSNKVIGSGDMRILRLQVEIDQVICLVGVY